MTKTVEGQFQPDAIEPRNEDNGTEPTYCEECGHFHLPGDTHPDREIPCGSYECCIN